MEIPQTQKLTDMPEAGRQLKKKIGKAKTATETEGQQSAVVNEVPDRAKPKVTATPKADTKTTSRIFDLLEQAGNYKQLKKGVNEVMKMLAKHKVEAVIMAADTDPLEMLMSLPSQCEEHSVPYCFVESTAALGRACGIQRYLLINLRPVIACCIIEMEGSNLNKQIAELKDTIEQLQY